MMGAPDPMLDLWKNLGPAERALLAQQQQQSYANLEVAKAQSAYTHGWSDPTLYVFGGNDPQRAYTTIPNDGISLAQHLLDQHVVKPRIRVPLYMYMVFVAVSCIALGIFLKLNGV